VIGYSCLTLAGRSVGQTATVDCGNSLFDLAAAASTAAESLPGTAADTVTRERPCYGGGCWVPDSNFDRPVDISIVDY